ncbi:hypothetical protein Q9L42_019515 [Methylomarinum sp. Ch1-1]|uniref:Uncharacterized protein n=1 Tax=Methylomarinum roseum TaxID=3067653 RepID=A0AAU7NU24_9GAMM|nr:hypothetical protein [Methylomarinum sp. Ch1-1]MDP4519415.1 hypothetical protein [Methylomarinum sp. Ch1-1]
MSLTLTHASDEETLAVLKTVKMVVSPIQQTERVKNIPYLCNHVVTGHGDHLLNASLAGFSQTTG